MKMTKFNYACTIFRYQEEIKFHEIPQKKETFKQIMDRTFVQYISTVIRNRLNKGRKEHPIPPVRTRVFSSP